jgi:hypothetical protein
MHHNIGNRKLATLSLDPDSRIERQLDDVLKFRGIPIKLVKYFRNFTIKLGIDSLINAIISKEFIQSGRDSRMDHKSHLGFNLYFYLAIKIYANDGRIHFEYGFSSSYKSIV